MTCISITEGEKHMFEIIEVLEHVLRNIANNAILLFEYVGVCVVIVSGIRGVFNYIGKDAKTRLNLGHGLEMGLTFMLCGEILRTIIVRDLEEIAIVGGIIVLRVGLTLLLHWERKNDQEEH